MQLNWRIPTNILFSCDKPEDLELPKFDYVYKNRVKIDVSLQSSTPVHDFQYKESKIKPFRHMDMISITAIDLENTEYANPLIAHLSDNNNEKLFKEILAITNKIMYTIRNFGFVPYIHEFFYEFNEFEKVIFLWKVHKSHDHGDNWIPVIPIDFEDEVKKYYFSLQNRETIQRVELEIARWNNIKAALQNKIPLPPEREFIINAAGHIGSNNYRLAVAESVIGLEIVLNQFLHLYLRKYKGFSEKKIKKFLPNEFTLSMKLSGLLELTLSNRSLENIDIERVREVVKWRNDVMHSTGNLERGKNHDYIINSVNHVFQLSALLRKKITELELLDENSTISKLFPLM
ncbi:hypothetical protein [Paenibacillus faecalis]|uniref:hypothetical protein n=1 Tax=Paenibacillus faecalis TaxID=2079532 RepID=UPI000D0FDEA9|nr:hypothetical protein [Paenibacillus faecalis]